MRTILGRAVEIEMDDPDGKDRQAWEKERQEERSRCRQHRTVSRSSVGSAVPQKKKSDALLRMWFGVGVVICIGACGVLLPKAGEGTGEEMQHFGFTEEHAARRCRSSACSAIDRASS